MSVKFKILFWKNCLTEKRMWPFLLAEICAILIIGVLILANSSRSLRTFKPNEEERKSVRIHRGGPFRDLSIIKSIIQMEDWPNKLVYSPDTEFANYITNKVAGILNLKATSTYKPEETFAMVTMGDHSDADAPNNLTLRIRFPGFFRTFQSSREESSMWLTRCTGSLTYDLDDVENYTQTDLYIREGFLQIQHLYFEQWIGKTLTNIFMVESNSFRYDTRQMMCQPSRKPNILSLLYYFTYFLPFVNLVWKYGRETEENLMSHHWRYGCSKFKYWLSHLVVSYFHFFLLGLLVLILTYLSWQTNPAIGYKNNNDIVYLLGIILLAILELIITAMVIVTLVPNAKSAVYLAILMWIILYAVFAIVLEYSYEIQSPWTIFALVTFFNNDFAYGMRYIVNLTEESANDVWMLFATMAFSILLKIIALALVNHLCPGRYMRRVPFCDQSCNKIRCCECCYCNKPQKLKMRVSQIVNRDNYQFGPLFGEKVLIATKLAKSFKKVGKNVKPVVKRVSITVFKGEITVLFGHNGCGKTTLISLFAGWRKPDDGSIHIDDHDVVEHPNVIRKVDVSMPNNTLFDYLTAVETLRYFVHIKSRDYRDEQFKEEIKNWLKTLKPVLPPKEANKKLVHEMTFEQKRLLNLCCVLCCDTRVILLDEPTLHMRTPEQRLYWSILQREKAERAIILATFSFREAETVADRIAVLTDGVLKAYGTPMFLKTTFGVGFDLIILKEKNVPSGPITSAIQEYVPDIEPHSEKPTQLVYKIPHEKRSVFQSLLINLQKKRAELGITDARMLTIDLSEVYMSLGRVKNRQFIPSIPQNLAVEYLPKRKRIKQQWSAMFFKKFTHQPSTIIPIYMCIFSFLLVFVLNAMINVLRSRSVNGGEMVLGYDQDSPERYLSKMMKDCKFIGIKSVEIGNSILRERKHAFIFNKDSFHCYKGRDFKDYIYLSKDNDKMYHLYGALGIQDNDKYDLFINQHIFHSAPLVLNLLHNYILEKYFAKDKTKIARLVLDPQPAPTPHPTGRLDSELEYLHLPIVIGIMVPLTVSTFIFAVARERNENILIMMAIAGLRVDIYWLVNLFWDWATYFIYTILFQIVIMAAFYKELGFANAWYLLLLNNVYSIPALGSIYFISMFKFFSHYRAYLVAILVHIISGLFAYVLFWDVFMAQDWFSYILMFSPSFAMLDGVSGVYVMSKFEKQCEDRCNDIEICDSEHVCKTLPECCKYHFFQWGTSGIVRSLVFLVISTLIVILLMCWVEIHRRENKFFVDSKIKHMHTKTYPYDDDDIVKMRDRIARSELRTIAKQRLVVDQVEGSIPQRTMYLTTTSFDVEKKSILAIYGTQHVGKTHLCRQIIGEDSFRFGDIYLRGIPIKYNMHDAWVHLGYSPQMDGALLGFTPIEVMHFFCLLRGVPANGITLIVNDLCSLFGLTTVMRRRIGRLSKGTQRKVTIAIAFISSNKVIILDEPTRGLPQWTRREIWKALIYMRSCGKTIVFTTTDMYECDALADNVLLIDDGEMLAYGGSHYLRRKHVVGFYLEVRLRRDGNITEEVEENLRLDVENLHRFMIFMHSESIMLNRIDNCLKFYLPVEKVNFNLLYGSLEKNRVRLNISQYTVSQGNFEEVLSNLSSKREHKNSIRSR